MKTSDFTTIGATVIVILGLSYFDSRYQVIDSTLERFGYIGGALIILVVLFVLLRLITLGFTRVVEK